MSPDTLQIAAFGALGDFLTAILPGTVKMVVAQTNRVPEPNNTDFVVMNVIGRTRLATNQNSDQDASFVGSISGTVMTITQMLIGTVVIGRTLFGTDVAGGTTIVNQLTGTPGGIGTYTVSQSQTVASEKLAAGAIDHLQETELMMQLDVHGPNSGDNVQVITTLFRDDYGVSWFEDYSAAHAPLKISPLYIGGAMQIPQTPFINAEQQYEDRWVLRVRFQIDVTVTAPQQFADELVVTTAEVDALYPV